MRYMKYILLAALAILLANTAYADNYHHRTTTNVYTDSKGVAIAAASGHRDSCSSMLTIPDIGVFSVRNGDPGKVNI